MNTHIAMTVDLVLLSIFSSVIQMQFELSKKMEYWFYFALFYAYNTFMDSYHQQTLGKMILKIRVVKTDGTKPDLLTAFYRNFGKIASALPLGYGYLRILAPHRKQTIHDELGKCFVIEL